MIMLRAAVTKHKQRPVDLSSKAFVFTCGGAGSYASGLYELSDLDVSPLTLIGKPPPKLPNPRKPLVGAPEALLAEAGYALIQTDCTGAPSAPEFQRLARSATTEYMVRK